MYLLKRAAGVADRRNEGPEPAPATSSATPLPAQSSTASGGTTGRANGKSSA